MTRVGHWVGRAAALAVPVALLFAGGCVSRKVTAVSAPGSLRIVSLTAEPAAIRIDEQSLLTAEVDNPNGGELQYFWSAYQGVIAGQGAQVYYIGSYCCAGTDFVVLTVRNEHDEAMTRTLVMTVSP